MIRRLRSQQQLQQPRMETTTKSKGNDGSVSMKSSTKRKSSAKLNNEPAAGSHGVLDDDIEFSDDDDDEKFHGFSSDEIIAKECVGMSDKEIVRDAKVQISSQKRRLLRNLKPTQPPELFANLTWKPMTSKGASPSPPSTANKSRLKQTTWTPDRVPGAVGLQNDGNTCYINTVLQCLSHTDILAEYFVLDQYKADLMQRNKINSRESGTKGELTEQLALVLKVLWAYNNESDYSKSFKAVVNRYGSQFQSSTQEDAQESLLWLLDEVHQDLNTASKRKYKLIKNNYGRTDQEIAAETLDNYNRCNNSFVQSVFQAQLRSSLWCPRCRKQSNTFDPIHCISVHLPQLAQQSVFVTVLYANQHPCQVKFGLSVPSGSPFFALREQLRAHTGIPLNRMVLTEINKTGFVRVFCDSQPISILSQDESIYCFETIDDESNKAKASSLSNATRVTRSTTSSTAAVANYSNTTAKLTLLIMNVKRSSPKDKDMQRFGTPFCVQTNRDISYTELGRQLLEKMSAILKIDLTFTTSSKNEMFKIRLQEPSAGLDSYIESNVEHPLLTEMIDAALSVLPVNAGPQHVKLLLEWDNPGAFICDTSDSFDEHESVSQLQNEHQSDTTLTLNQCLEHYTKPETLSTGDAWRCSHCQKYSLAVRTLDLWSLPDILVIHIKRFRQQHTKGPQSDKLTTTVQFPLTNFDMSPYLAREDSNDDLKNNRYDLYAVCYHQGDTLETGHYTAACKNSYDDRWYKFDDQRVNVVPNDRVQDEIVNSEAYILFYQRRKIDLVENSGFNSSGVHWVSKMRTSSIGIGKKEIVRDAKVQISSQKRRSLRNLKPTQPPEWFAKRTRKPMISKGASPSPPSTANKSRIKCDKCSKSFTRPDNFKQHQKIVHGKTKDIWSCCKCQDKCFSRKSNLRRHVKREHNSKDFRKIMEEAEHRSQTKMKKGYPTCYACNKSFKSENNKQIHMTLYHSNSIRSPSADESEIVKSPNTKEKMKPNVVRKETVTYTIITVDQLLEQMDQDPLLSESTGEQSNKVQQSNDLTKSSSKPKEKRSIGQKAVIGWNFKKIRTNLYSDSHKSIRLADSPQCNCKFDYECGENCINRLLYMECNPGNCPCGDQCKNNKIQKGINVPVERFMTENKGWGIRTNQLIEKDTYIIEYMGDVINEHEFKKRMVTFYKDDIHHYCLNLERGLVIDAHRMGNECRFVNHACEPNCVVQKWSVNGLPRLALFAMRDIQPGEELTFDYNFSLFNPHQSQVCKCESKNCRGVIDGKSQRDRTIETMLNEDNTNEKEKSRSNGLKKSRVLKKKKFMNSKVNSRRPHFLLSAKKSQELTTSLTHALTKSTETKVQKQSNVNSLPQKRMKASKRNC